MSTNQEAIMEQINDFHMTPQNRPFLFAKLEKLDPKVVWTVSAVPVKRKRTLSQNARYWAFLTAFGNYIGYTKDEMHQLCTYKFLFDMVEVNGEPMKKLRSTPKEGTKEFAEYCELCEMWAAQNGFVWGER